MRPIQINGELKWPTQGKWIHNKSGKCTYWHFSQELHVYFSRTMTGFILHELRHHYFVPAVQICLLLKYGASWIRRPRTVEKLKPCIHQERANITLAKLQQLIYWVPKGLQSVIKRWCYPVVNMPLSQQIELSSSVKTLQIFSLSFCLLNKGSSEWTNYRFEFLLQF